MVRVLGIETSCDETAASVVALEDGVAHILSNVVLSQIEEHAAFGCLFTYSIDSLRGRAPLHAEEVAHAFAAWMLKSAS